MGNPKYVFFLLALLIVSKSDSYKGLDLRWGYLTETYSYPQAEFTCMLDAKTDSAGVQSYVRGIRRGRWQISTANIELKRLAVMGRKLDLCLGDHQYRDARSSINLRGLQFTSGDTRISFGKVREGSWQLPSFEDNQYFAGFASDLSIVSEGDFAFSATARRDRHDEEGTFYNRVLTAAWRCKPGELLVFPLEMSLSLNNLRQKEVAGLSYRIGGAFREKDCLLSLDYRHSSQSYISPDNRSGRERKNLNLVAQCGFARYLRFSERFNLGTSVDDHVWARSIGNEVEANLFLPEFPVFSVSYEVDRQERTAGGKSTIVNGRTLYFQALKNIGGFRFRLDGRAKGWTGDFLDTHSLYSLSMRKRLGAVELGLREELDRGYASSSLSLTAAAGPVISLTEELTIGRQRAAFSIGANISLPKAMTLSFIHRNETGERDGASLWLSLGKNVDLEHFGHIRGVVFVDVNRNGVMDTREKGLMNVTVVLDGGLMCRTDARGEFSFEDVERGIHTISMDVSTLSARYNPAFPIERPVLSKWVGSSKVLFPVHPIIRVRGRVFIDSDGNNRPDRFEKGLAGVSIHNLTSGHKTVTDQHGRYYFGDALPGVNEIALDTSRLREDYRVAGSSLREVALKSYAEARNIDFVVVRTLHAPQEGSFKIAGIQFDQDSPGITSSSYPLLERATELLRTHSDGQVTIHLLNPSSTLASRRFASLIEYFESMGVSTERFRIDQNVADEDLGVDAALIDIRVGNQF